MRMVSRHATSEGTVAIIQMAVPMAVLDLLTQALDLAGKTTGSPRLGAQLAAVSQEFLGTWSTPMVTVPSPRKEEEHGR